jgi:enoyl-CoA hydratase/carnithine racemase/alkylhydroperoxidase family enzyme
LPETVLVAIEAGLAVVTLSRPDKRNALSSSMLAELAGKLGEPAVRGSRAVILRGAGGCFSAGADLTELDGTANDLAMGEAIGRTAGALRDLEVPVVAAVEGPCMGGAVELAMACDLRVASQTALFEIPAVRLGILYRPQAYAEMAATLPAGTLIRLALLGERMDAAEAQRAGLVSVVVPPGQAREEAVRRLSSLPGPGSAAVTLTKRLLRDIALGGFDAGTWAGSRREMLSAPGRRRPDAPPAVPPDTPAGAWHAPLAELPPDVARTLQDRGARQLNLYRALSSSPEVVRAWLGYIWSLRDDCVATPRLLRELVILRTAVRHGSAYEWHHHRIMAAGLGEEKLAAVAGWRDATVFDEAERTALELADAVCDGEVPAGVARAVAERFGDRGLVELAVTAAAYVMVPRVLSALGVEIEPS